VTHRMRSNLTGEHLSCAVYLVGLACLYLVSLPQILPSSSLTSSPRLYIALLSLQYSSHTLPTSAVFATDIALSSPCKSCMKTIPSFPPMRQINRRTFARKSHTKITPSEMGPSLKNASSVTSLPTFSTDSKVTPMRPRTSSILRSLRSSCS
jgi:hypothetical protein